MNKQEYARTSKFLSLILRHKPEAIGVKLDEHGWANVNDVIKGMKITLEDLEYIVDTDEKGRYTFDSSKTLIRANQGHSIKVDLDLEEKKPPIILYHGTAIKYEASIFRNGIQKMSRQYVHLSADISTATRVGNRHGNLCLLVVRSGKMYVDGYKFYLSKNNVWLTDNVPVKYIDKLS